MHKNCASWCIVGLLVAHLILQLLEAQRRRCQQVREGYVPSSVADKATTLMMMDDDGNLLPVSWNEIRANIQADLQTVKDDLESYKTKNDKRVGDAEATVKTNYDTLKTSIENRARDWINWAFDPKNASKLEANRMPNVNQMWLRFMNSVTLSGQYKIMGSSLGGKDYKHHLSSNGCDDYLANHDGAAWCNHGKSVKVKFKPV